MNRKSKKQYHLNYLDVPGVTSSGSEDEEDIELNSKLREKAFATQ
jgi:hypothetical protein